MMSLDSEADSLLRRARIKLRDMATNVERGEYVNIIQDASNVTLLAAGAALTKCGLKDLFTRPSVTFHTKMAKGNERISPELQDLL